MCLQSSQECSYSTKWKSFKWDAIGRYDSEFENYLWFIVDGWSTVKIYSLNHEINASMTLIWKNASLICSH